VILFTSWSGVEPDAAFQLMNGTATAWGAPLFVGEFGAPGPTEEGGPYMETLYRHLDDRLSSGAQWVFTPGWTEAAKDGWNDEDFSIVDGAGALRPNFPRRPFPRAIAGKPTSFLFEDADAAADRRATLAWDNVPAAGKTELFVPEETFGAAPLVTTTGEGLSCAWDGRLLLCGSASAGAMRVVLTMAEASPEPEPGGCGCRAAGGGSPDRGVVLAGVLSILGLVRGRRRRGGRRPSDRG
jgi:endoglycosylceramidase